MSAEVFISYASQDRERILTLVNGLNSAGVSVWIDQMSIEGATMWSQEIVAAIRNCKVLILAISKKSGSSENVVKEVALASEGRKRILPVYLEQAEIPESMAYQLAGIQRVEFFRGNEEAGHQSVIRALAKLGITVNDEASIALAGGPKRTSHGISHSTTGQAAISKRSAWMKIAVAVGGVVALVTSLFFLTGGGSETNEQGQTKPLAKVVRLDANRVVVLPFKTIGTSGETADLGYGLVSTLTSKLQPLQNLTVIAKESARMYEDTKLPPREIGKALSAGTIVTGEIQTSSDKVQVNIQLVNANTEALGWGKTFTKSKNDFLDMQNEIATKLAIELKGGLDADETQLLAQKATENAKAQTEYEAGRREWNNRNKEGFEKAIKHFEKAIELDSNYAEPYAGLCDTYGLLPVYNFSEPGDAMPKAKSYALNAIKLNPNLANAYTSLGLVQHVYEYDWSSAEKNYRKAIKLNPNYATGHQWLGELLYHTGKELDSFDHLSKAVKLDPNSKIIKCEFASCCLLLNRNELALQALDDALKIDPFFHYALELKYLRLKNENIESAIKIAEKAQARYVNQPEYLSLLFQLNWKAGHQKQALRYFVEILDMHRDKLQDTVISGFYFMMGEPDNACRWLKSGIDKREAYVPYHLSNPMYKKYHSLPAFEKLLKQINHPIYLNKK